MRALVVLTIVATTLVVSRVLPHPPNFVPVVATTLFGAACVNRRWHALAVPLLGMLASDVALEVGARLIAYGGWMASVRGFYPGMWYVYGALACVAFLGMWLQHRRNLWPAAGVTLGGSLVYFVLTNLGVWISSDLYPHDWHGLVACYVAALPFYRNQLAADVLFAPILVGGYVLTQRRWPALGATTPENL
ncbi:MAG: hypothetical protein C4297_12395 [Gemmataceae bacterium]